ncbi:MAG: hypothetical protein J6W06_04965 [Bacteroidales bacterium]|jgi:hypothetical protein|nr:hypothetical protein [Bacteroidales bacterium]
MNRILLVISILCLIFALSSCKSDFDVNDKWQDSPAIFCILDKSQDMQYVKVNKCFLGNLPASEMASVSDSLFYDCDIQVKLHRKQGNTILKTWEFRPVDSIPKESGYFASDRNTIWVGKPDLNADYTYEVEVNIDNGRIIAKGETKLVDGSRITAPDARSPKIELARYYNDFSIKYIPSDNVNLQEVNVNFNYLEIKSNGDTVPKSIQVYNNLSYRVSSNSYTAVEQVFGVGSFYSSLAAQINNDDATVVKRLVKMPDCMTFTVSSADENLYTYMQVTKPSSGIAQDRPIFTNIYIDESSQMAGGAAYGLMASRYTVSLSKAVGSETLDSISRGIYTNHLMFPPWTDNYYITHKPYNK